MHSDLDALRPDLDQWQAAKLGVLAAAQDWYEQGCLLAAAVPLLETVAADYDEDAAFLACVLLEQALVDGWYDYDPPRSLVTPQGVTADLLARLRQCAAAQRCADVVIRARLACALADTGLTERSSAADAQAVYGDLLDHASAGRYLHAGGLVLARGARAFAMHGDTGQAVNLWRRSILLASEARLYGDVLGSRRALNAAILEHPVPAFDEIDYPTSTVSGRSRPGPEGRAPRGRPTRVSCWEGIRHPAKVSSCGSGKTSSPRDGVVLVAQSFAGFTVPLAAGMARVERIVLVNAMVPAPGESAAQWWEATGWAQAFAAAALAGGYPAEPDRAIHLLHDVPPDVAAAEPPQRIESPAALEMPCDFAAWPDVPTQIVTGAEDRFFPACFQAAVAVKRLGIEPGVLPGGHLIALSQPAALAACLLRGG